MLQSGFFPLHELFSATPLTHLDGAFHLYRSEVFRALCHQGQLLGYDPFFGAGQLRGLTYSSSAKLQAFLACAWPGPHAAAVTYKLSSFVLSLLAMVALPLTCAVWRLPAAVSTVATLFGFVLWWATPLRWFHTAGMVSFVTAAFLSLPYSAWLAATCTQTSVSRWRLFWVAMLGGLGTVLHALFAVCVAAMVLSLLAARLWREAGPAGARPGHFKQTLLTLTGVVSAATLFNAPWFYDALRLPAGALRGDQPFQRIVDPLLPFKEVLLMAPTQGGGSRFYLVLVLACLCLPWAGAKARLGSVSSTLSTPVVASLLAALGLMVFASVGAVHPILGNLFQPNRFLMVAWLILAIPAAVGAVGVWQRLRSQAWDRRVWPSMLPLLQLVLVAAGTLFYLRELALEVHGAPGPRYGVTRPEVKPLGALSTSLRDWLQSTAPGDGRVLFEVSQGGAYDRAQMAGPLAWWAQRELIGGPYPHFHFASFEDGILFGRPVADYTRADLEAYLDLYNITAIVCHSKACQSVFDSWDQTPEAARWGVVSAHRRQAVSTYVLAGQGRVLTRRVNRIELEATGGEELVLKYHWVPGLASEPPLPIEGRKYLKDPQPFVVIKLPRAPSSPSNAAPLRFYLYVP